MIRFSSHAALLAIVLSLLRSPSSAAEPAPSKALSSAATAQLETASAAITQGSFPAAYQALVAVYPQAPAQAIYYLGRLAAAEGQAVAAQDLLRRFLADQSVEAADPLRSEAQKLLDGLASRESGEVSVGAPRGAVIQLDGRLVGTLPLPLPLLVATGVHRLQVSQGRWRAETEFQVRTARSVEIRFKSGSDLAVVTRPAAVLYCEQLEGDSTGASETLGHAVETAVKHENYSLLSRQAALAYAPDLAACEPPPANTLSPAEAQVACCAALAQRFAIERVLDVRLTAGGDWNTTLRLRETDVDGEVRGDALACAGCGVKEASQRLSDGVAKLFAQADRQGRGSLQIASTPVGAEVRLAGRRVGVTPYSRKVWAGSYELELRHPGHVATTQTVEVGLEQPASVSVDLPPEQVAVAAPVPKAPPRRPAWRIGAGAAGLAVGALMVGFGISGLSVNGDCSLDRQPACDGIYRTGAIGGSLVGLGGALMIGGAVLVALPPSK